jgi:hypothetical protein
MAQTVPVLSSRRLGFEATPVHQRSAVYKVTWRPAFLPVLLFSLIITIPPMLHIHLHLHVVLTRRTNGLSLGTLTNKQTQCSFGNRAAFGSKAFHLVLKRLTCGQSRFPFHKFCLQQQTALFSFTAHSSSLPLTFLHAERHFVFACRTVIRPHT